MNTELLIAFRSVYGQTLAYPINEQAQLLAKLTGRKTLTAEALRTAQLMGFRVVHYPDQEFGYSAVQAYITGAL